MKKEFAYYGRTRDGKLLAFDLATQSKKKEKVIWPYVLAAISLIGILCGVLRII